MRLAISNLAWKRGEREAVASLLSRLPVEGVELAPTMIWESPLEATPAEILEERRFWETTGLEIVAIQSVLFGRPDLQVFADPPIRLRTRTYLEGMIRLAGRLGAGTIVFGSPGNRRTEGLSPDRANRIAVPFFESLGRTALNEGTCFCIEPNPVEYGCDYVTSSAEGLQLVREVETAGFGLHLDSAAMTLAGESPGGALERVGRNLHHFHISEPRLAPIGGGQVAHDRFASALAGSGYDGWVSIEMLAPASETSSLPAIERAVLTAARAYLGGGSRGSGDG